jgi:uncharacterized membrane protein YeaQ/YmgE (transglycosylase-associated protein family)
MGFDPYSFIVAIIGAVLVLIVYHALTDARPATRF